jgi:hypothetical protein
MIFCCLTDDNSFKGDVSQVQKSGQNSKNVGNFRLRKEQDFHGRSNFSKFIGVVSSLARCAVSL